MSFFGSYVYASVAAAQATKEEALAGPNDAIALTNENILQEGLDVRFNIENHFPSTFYDNTMVALSTIAAGALCGTGGGTCGEWGDDGYESSFRTVPIEIDVLRKPLDHTQQLMVQYLLTGNANDIHRAHSRMARVSDIPTLGRIWEALPAPVLKARLARIFVGRSERRAQIVRGKMATLAFDDSDPHAQEIREILGELARDELAAAVDS